MMFKMLTIRLDKEFLFKVKVAAMMQDVPVSVFVRNALEKALK